MENKIMRVFISQPMNGKTKEEIAEVRERAIRQLTLGMELGNMEVIDSKCHEDRKTPLEYMAYSIGCLAKADIAYFAKGWENSRGCTIEHECAIKYGIETVDAKKLIIRPYRQVILDLLLLTLKATVHLKDLCALRYYDDSETVCAVFPNEEDTIKISVKDTSGAEMVILITQQLLNKVPMER